MTRRTNNLREIVLDGLLTGEALNAPAFSKRHGLVCESVSRALRDLGRYLEKVPGKNGAWSYRAVDMASLQRIRNEKRIGTNQYSNGAVDAAAALSFDELLSAWGVRKVDLDLPRTTHIMHDEPEAAQV